MRQVAKKNKRAAAAVRLDLEAPKPANFYEPIRVLDLHRSKASSLERSQRPAEKLAG